MLSKKMNHSKIFFENKIEIMLSAVIPIQKWASTIYGHGPDFYSAQSSTMKLEQSPRVNTPWKKNAIFFLNVN